MIHFSCHTLIPPCPFEQRMAQQYDTSTARSNILLTRMQCWPLQSRMLHPRQFLCGYAPPSPPLLLLSSLLPLSTLCICTMHCVFLHHSAFLTSNYTPEAEAIYESNECCVCPVQIEELGSKLFFLADIPTNQGPQLPGRLG